MDNQLLVPVQENNLNSEKGIMLQNAFAPFFEQAKELAEKAKAINVTSPDQLDAMTLARESRLALKELRVNVDKQRKAMKEESIREGKAIEGLANVVKFLIVPIEKHLQEQEDFVKEIARKQKQELNDKRKAALEQYDVDCQYYDLADMPEPGYIQLLESSKLAYENKVAAEKKIEDDRIAREKAEKVEQDRIKAENEKLKKEKEAADKKEKLYRDRLAQLNDAGWNGQEAFDKTDNTIIISYEDLVTISDEKFEGVKKTWNLIIENRFVIAEAECLEKEAAEKKAKEELDAQLKEERDENERIQKALDAKEAEEKKQLEDKRLAKEAEEKEANAAKLAPDKDKLKALGISISKIELPDVTSQEAKNILKEVVTGINQITAKLSEQLLKL